MTISTPVQRVLMTADTVGGVWTYAMELSHALSDRGVEIILNAGRSPKRRSESGGGACPGSSLAFERLQTRMDADIPGRCRKVDAMAA